MPTDQEPNNKENVILRALEGDPKRYKPLLNHPPPTTTEVQKATPAPMYTMETRYQRIPQKVLPNQKQATLYHLRSDNAQEKSAPKTPPPLLREEELEPRVPVEEEAPPVVFLEPKIISQPILYCIVGDKNTPIVNEQPVSVDNNQPLPIFHTVIGHPRHVAKENAGDMPSEEVDRRPLFYSIISNPRFNVTIQEPVKQISQPPKQPSAVPYTVTNSSQAVDPVKQRSVPTLYSIVGGPMVTSQISKAQFSDRSPAIQSENNDFLRPVPILYTIVGDSQAPADLSREYRPPLAATKQQNHQTALYTVIGAPTIPQSMPLPSKTRPAQAKPEEPSSSTQQPFLYSIVGRHNSLSEEDLLKPVKRRRSPPPAIIPTRRVSRSLDRQAPPDDETGPVSRIPRLKPKRLPKIRDSTAPRSETIFFPLPQSDRAPRPKYVPNPPPWKTDYELSNGRNYQIARYQPLELPDYISPYAYHPARAYREATVHPASLPIIGTPRKARQPNEDGNSPNRKRRHDPRTPHSLERYHGKSKRQPRLWDFEYQAQTDIEDDDGNGMHTSRSKQHERRFRPRTPWIPVW